MIRTLTGSGFDPDFDIFRLIIPFVHVCDYG